MIFKIICGNHFVIQVHCDLDLRPSDPIINRGHLLVKTNLYVKYEDFVINGFHDNQRKPYGLQTNISKTIYPLFLEGGEYKVNTFTQLLLKHHCH